MSKTTSGFTRRLLVIGNGMVGHRFCELLTELDVGHGYTITVGGEEPRVAYDRVHLSQYLADRTPERVGLQ